MLPCVGSFLRNLRNRSVPRLFHTAQSASCKAFRGISESNENSKERAGRVGRSAAKQQQQETQLLQQGPQDTRRLTLAVVGLPNAGKSTLTNRLIGHKISGVSSKRNTTIEPQLGSFNVGNSQVLLYDTPGLVDQPGQGNPVERLHSAWATAASADWLLLIVDAERQFRLQDPALPKLIQQVAAGPLSSMASAWQQPPALLFLNKQDKLDTNIRSTVLQQLRQQLCGMLDFKHTFEGAAMRGDGVEDLRDFLVKQAQPGTWLMPAGQSHAASPGELAVELVREKLYRRLNQELPYRLTVTLEGVTPGPPAGRGLTIQIAVGAATKLIKSIVVGKGGAVIQKYVAEPTQGELSRILKQQVKLVVSVRVTG